MIDLTVEQIARIVGGTLTQGTDPETVVTGPVEFDSRKVSEGSLFVALAGARVDGHDFVPAALESGAAAALVAHPVKIDSGLAPAIVVPPATGQQQSANSYATEHDEDGSVAAVLQGMGLIARKVIDTLTAQGLTVMGVTGSAGKTSTKDMLASILSNQAPTVAPPGSFNNEIGHPYTALRCTEQTRYLVAEMSARGIGHIAHLAQIAPPKIGVVLNVGTAHIGEFGSREVIAQAKGELAEALPHDGVAVLNADDDLVAGMRTRTDAKVITFSANSQDADVYATDIELDDYARARFTLHIGEAENVVTLQVAGQHQVSNALAAAAAAYAAGITIDDIAEALSNHLGASAHRMALMHRSDGATIIDDAYNANTESMRAGLTALSTTAHNKSLKGDASHAWAVLGPMSELGEESVAAHEEIGRLLGELNVHGLIVVGDSADSLALADGARRSNVTTLMARDTAEAADLLDQNMGSADVALVKASNAYRLWETAEILASK